MDEDAVDIDIASTIYLLNGTQSPLDAIPEQEIYIAEHYQPNNQLVYREWRTKVNVQRIVGYANGRFFQTMAQSLFAHVKRSEPGLDLHELELDIAISIEDFAVDFQLEDSENCQILAVFLARDRGQQALQDDAEQGFAAAEENREPDCALGALEGFLVEINTEAPVAMTVKQLIYTADKKLMSSVYTLPSLGADNEIVQRFSFFESCDARLTDEEQSEAGVDIHPFPQVSIERLEQDQKILQAEKVAVLDLEGCPIEMSEISHCENYIRQWVNSEEIPVFIEIFLERGIATTEIIDIPQNMHRRVLHAYLRRIHSHRELISLSNEAGRYVYLHEPFSQESTAKVPLQSGQIKRHSSLFTVQGVRVACECHVFDSNMRPVKCYSFGKPNEEHLMTEEIFQYDAQGNMLESERVNYLN